MVQVPAASSITVLPLTVQMVGVLLLKLTARPDVAVAFSTNGALPNFMLGNGPNAMVWLCPAPVPLTANVNGVPLALLVMLTVAVRAPAALGVKVI